MCAKMTMVQRSAPHMTKAKPKRTLPARMKVTDPAVSGRKQRPSEIATLPPPGPRRDTPGHSERVKKGLAAARIDEVTADLSKDPRHERD